MKSRRLKFAYNESASKLHKKTGETLRSSEVFGKYKLYQEYPVNRINTSYPSGKEKFDWVILDLKVVIEVHGQHHYIPIRWGNIRQEQAEQALQEQQQRDRDKKAAAEAAGYTYIVIPYNEIDLVSEDYILKKIKAFTPILLVTPTPVVTIDTRQQEYKNKIKAKMKAFRRERYLKMKELKAQCSGKDQK